MAATEESGKEEELSSSNLYTSTSDHHVQRRQQLSSTIGEESSPLSSETGTMPCLTSREAKNLWLAIQAYKSSFKKDSPETETSNQPENYLSFLNKALENSDIYVRQVGHSSSTNLPEHRDREPLKENCSSCNKHVKKHRTRMKEMMPCLKEKYQDTLMEGNRSNSETKRRWEDARIEEAAFWEKLEEAELAIGSTEKFLPLFKETVSRVSQACHVSSSDMVEISMQEDLLVKELMTLESVRGVLQKLLRTSKEKEINTKLLGDLTQKLTEVENEIKGLKSEILQKERYMFELSEQLQKEKNNILKASDQYDSIQSVQTHLQRQIDKKEAENYQLRTKLQIIEKKIADWKFQIAECKQQILIEKERKEELKIALRRAASVQKQRAEHLEAVVENITLKIKEKETQLSEAFSASNAWKSRHDMVADEKTRLEDQIETLKKQVTDQLMELKRIKDDGKKSKREILGKINAVISENEAMSLENAKLKGSAAALEAELLSTEAELTDLREEAKQQEYLAEQYKSEVGKLETEAEELKVRYEKVIDESRKLTEGKDLEMDVIRDQSELKELEHVRDLQKAAEEKLRNCQQSLLSCQKSCVDKSKVIRELQMQADNDSSFLKQHYLEDKNYNIQMEYEEVQRKLEEMESENKELENKLEDQEENLQKIEIQFKQKVANYDALTRQVEVALEDGRKKLEEEEEKVTSKERLLQLKILDLENELRQKKEEHKRLTRKLNTFSKDWTARSPGLPDDKIFGSFGGGEKNAKRREVNIKELEHSLQKSENQNQSIHNYVQFLKNTYVTMFG